MLQISGREIAGKIVENLKSQPVPKKILAAVLVGEDTASISFLKQKEKIAKELGVDFRLYKFNKELRNDDLRREIGKIAKLNRVGGIIVQLPLPEGVNRRYVLNAIPIEKDVDVLGEKAQEAFRSDKSKILPPAVGVVDEIIETYNLELKNLKTAVVGAGFLVGKPLSEWLKDKCQELKVFEIGSDLNELKSYDLVISGVGKAGLIKPDMLKNSATVIDFGYDMVDGKIHGDLDASELEIRNSKLEIKHYTPTPGGTGPILVAKLMENFYKLNL